MAPSGDAFRSKEASPISDSLDSKRYALSIIGCFYDPVGWISPVTVGFKIFMHSLWILKMPWDDSLPLASRARWNVFMRRLSDLSRLAVPRWIGTSKENL